MVRMNAYISFRDKAREAGEFYHSVFGGKLEATTFKEGGVPHDEAEGDNIMHSMLEADHGMVMMLADTPKSMEYKPGTNISMSVSGDEEEPLTGYFNKLSEGGKVSQPLVKAPWGDTFGMVTDKFGIHWMVNITGKPE